MGKFEDNETTNSTTTSMAGALVALPLPTETWFEKKWRPSAAYTYLAICWFDFVLAPIGQALLDAYLKVDHVVWHPLTLEGGGLFHISFGAILGISAYGRTREKIANATDSNEETK